ncbi:phospholipid carrier-dependent glycosyltransferase [Candidatus Microgenomates bacterium]|nr:phospholipid carrier-dependent glycosyltransferase [Candidatus Microgenomates bacterium]
MVKVKIRQIFIPLVIAIAFLIVGVLTLSHYGINWDAPIHMMRGQAFLHYFLTGKTSYDLGKRTSPMLVGPKDYASRYYLGDTEYIAPPFPKQPVSLPERPLIKAEFEDQLAKLGKRVSFYQYDGWGGEFWLNFDGGHPPLIDILAALSNRFFYGWLGVLGDIESYQLIYILISALGVFLAALFTYEISGSYLASLAAGLSLAFHPFYFAESHINMKDPSQAVFFMGAIWAFYLWVKEGRSFDYAQDRSGRWGGLGRFGVFIIFVALALATKWNIVFLPFILIPWLFLIRKTEEFKAWFKLGSLREARRLGVLGLVGGVGVIAFIILIWPYLWDDPLGKLKGILGFYSDVGSRSSSFNLAWYVPTLLLFQTPEIILILGVVGMIGVIRERGGPPVGGLKSGYLILSWIVVTLLRVSTPKTWGYGEIRQVMEIIPAMALLAGVGGFYLVRKTRNNIIIITIITVITIILLVPIIRLHPNQNYYFNSLIEGLKGAYNRNMISWGSSNDNIYKQAAMWLNKNAPTDANIAHLQGPDFSLSPLFLRRDISISPHHFSGYEQKGEYILVPLNPENPPIFAKRYPEKFLSPVHEIIVDGVSLLTIYKNDKQFLKPEFNKEKTDYGLILNELRSGELYYWKVNLEKQVLVTRITLDYANPECLIGEEGNERVLFVDQSGHRELHSNLEKKDLGGVLEYEFAAEPAMVIQIHPKNENSCFKGVKTINISFLLK